MVPAGRILLKKMTATGLFIILLLLIVTPALSSQNIIWYQPDFPPYMIIDGPDKDRGIDNQIVNTAISLLPDYDHSFEVANYRRILDNLSQGVNGIVTPLFKTPGRQQFIRYSRRPSYYVLPNGFIYRKAEMERYRPFLNEEGILDLEALCRSGEFFIGINAGRSYYGILDILVQSYKGSTPFYIRNATDQLGILNMVARERVDAALGFPVEIKYVGLEKELGFFPVSGMVELIPVYFGASMTQKGSQIIEILDSLLEDRKWQDQFKHYYMYWLDDELIPEYESLLKNPVYSEQ